MHRSTAGVRENRIDSFPLQGCDEDFRAAHEFTALWRGLCRGIGSGCLRTHKIQKRAGMIQDGSEQAEVLPETNVGRASSLPGCASASSCALGACGEEYLCPISSSFSSSASSSPTSVLSAGMKTKRKKKTKRPEFLYTRLDSLDRRESSLPFLCATPEGLGRVGEENAETQRRGGRRETTESVEATRMLRLPRLNSQIARYLPVARERVSGLTERVSGLTERVSGPAERVSGPATMINFARMRIRDRS